MPVRHHVEEDILLEFAEDRLDPVAAGRVRNHLSTGCERCAESLSFWRRSLTRISSAERYPVPEWTTHRALALFAPYAKERALWGRATAKLIFDSRMQLLPAGVRDLEQGSFKLLFEVEGAHVDLFCERESGRWSISGQVLTEKHPELGWNILAHGAVAQMKTDADALGEFRLQGLAPGGYDLLLSASDREIALPTITL